MREHTQRAVNNHDRIELESLGLFQVRQEDATRVYVGVGRQNRKREFSAELLHRRLAETTDGHAVPLVLRPIFGTSTQESKAAFQLLDERRRFEQ